jgi:RimJ/RimL family protein N-acetyltransferase
LWPVRALDEDGLMSTVADLFPPLGLTVEAGPVVLRGITDDLLVEICDLAARGIHGPDEMPFYFPWTLVPADRFAPSFAQYHWRCRADFAPTSWSLNLAVVHEGRVVGVQGMATDNFLVTRTGETGSWLGREFQGLGIGTAMRQVMGALAFDHLGFEEVTSAAFVDNPASLAVSRKVGYRTNGVRRLKRRDGELALNQGLVLSPEDFVRGEHELRVSGVAELRSFIGLDAA